MRFTINPMDGICTLANDRVYDQLIALLNSIEAILGQEFPVCVYPYNDKIEKIAAEIGKRPNVQLYYNQESMETWDQFARDVWDVHPTVRQIWPKVDAQGYYRFGTHRRYCAFDGPFERFLYMDADTLLMGPVTSILTSLESKDFVVYDFQYKKPQNVYNLSSELLKTVFPPKRIQEEIFCSGFYASKKGLFGQKKRTLLLEKLRCGEWQILYPMAPDQTILNYMVMRSEVSYENFAFSLPQEKRTGNCVQSRHFQERDFLLYDRDNPLTYLHYISLSSQLFAKVCAGKNIDFPYRDLFLHYRYLHEPEKRPQFTGKPQKYNQPPGIKQQILKKLSLINKRFKQ